jgi:hypothetical protein
MARAMIVALKGSAQQWYASLPKGSIMSWEQLRWRIENNFQGYQPQDLTSGDLHLIKQGDKEPFQEYIKQFTKARAKAPHVQSTTLIDATIDDLKVGPCREYLDRRRTKIEKQLFDIMQEYCKSDRGKQRRVDEYNKIKIQAKSQPEWGSRPQRNQGLLARQNFYNRSNVNNDSGNNSQMASLAAIEGRGQNSGKGPPPQSVCSLHNLNKGHWSYECRSYFAGSRSKKTRREQHKASRRQSITHHQQHLRWLRGQCKTGNFTSNNHASNKCHYHLHRCSTQTWYNYSCRALRHISQNKSLPIRYLRKQTETEKMKISTEEWT